MTTLAKNARAIEAVRPKDSRAAYTIKGVSGLRLVVHATGRKVWFAVYQLGSGASRKRRWVEIGEYSDHKDGWNLDRACAENKRLQAKAETGADDQHLTPFGDLFQSWLDEHAKQKLNTWKDELGRYRLHLEKPLGTKPIGEIERKDVREIRDSVLENSGPIQSNRVVALFNRVMNWAVDEDRAKFNPAARLKKVGEEQRRERTLTEAELKALWHELGQELAVDAEQGGLTVSDLAGTVAIRRAIKLLMLTGQRRGEVIGIAKAELDLDEDDPWWIIPAERTKNGLPHRVPLTDDAVDLITEAMSASGKSPYLFPSPKTDGPIRSDAVTKQLQRLCKRMVPKIEGVGPHDIRRTIGTTLRKLGVSVEDRGHVLNHVSGAKAKVTSWNYDAGEHDEEKRKALELWGFYLKETVSKTGTRTNILRLRG